MKRSFALFLLTTVICQISHAYELVMVQAVSNSKRSFATRNGKKDGIFLGQEATFTSEDVTIAAQAVEVSREFTQWEVKDPEAVVPFERHETVVLNTNMDATWYQIPLARIKPIELKRHLIAKLGYSSTITESIDQTSSTEDTTRRAFHFTGLFHTPVNKKFYFGGGLRVDKETAETSTISVPTNRYFALLSIEYYLSRLEYKQALLYIGAMVGIGRSTTTVAGSGQSGMAYLLPSVRMGLKFPLSETLSALGEVSFDNISMKEESNDGFVQSTTMVNGNLLFGLSYNF